MPYCSLTKASIYYEVIGDGIPIIMIHGFGVDHRLMKGCMEPIFRERSGFKRIYFDLPGMGKTKEYHQVENADDILETVLDFIQVVIPDQPYLLMGESYGGYLARGIVDAQREHVHGLCLLCPVIIPEKGERTLPAHTILYEDDGLLSQLTPREKEAFRSENVVLNKKNWVRYRDEVYAGIICADNDFLAKIEKHYGLSTVLEEDSFDKPSTFILGKKDAVVGYKDAFQILDRYQKASYNVLEQAGHYVQIEQADLFQKLVIEWLDRSVLD
ncbi:2-hydroxy-6-oxo-6-phenylhexa-2,4-dienoate hydrolase [Oceanobacillus iheyensis]|nr:2-hydroxy-6-oxo-6-phenylhexa-2,4-dienoate hydrolase [Oceanobacillus iheyensis]